MRSDSLLDDFAEVVPHSPNHQHSHQYTIFTLEGALVLLLYLSLLVEIIAIVRGRYLYIGNQNSPTKIRMLRPATQNTATTSCGICHDKKNIRSLDSLWRRMQKASNQMQLINLRHHMITKLMMEARMQAREREREKMHQKKEKLFANLLTPLGKTVRKMGRSFDHGI